MGRLVTRKEYVPTTHLSSRQHDLDDFSKNKPVQAEAEGARQRMRKHVQPRNAEREQQNFTGNRSDCSPCETPFPALKNEPGETCHKWIRDQVSASWAENLRDSADSVQAEYRTEHRQSRYSFNQVQRQRGEPAAASQRKAHE